LSQLQNFLGGRVLTPPPRRVLNPPSVRHCLQPLVSSFLLGPNSSEIPCSQMLTAHVISLKWEIKFTPILNKRHNYASVYLAVLILLGSTWNDKRLYTKWYQTFNRFKLVLISSCWQFQFKLCHIFTSKAAWPLKMNYYDHSFKEWHVPANTNPRLHHCGNLKSCCTSYLYIVRLSCILIMRH
jgi:hypothetical protein